MRRRNIYIAGALCIVAGAVLTGGGMALGGRPGITISSSGVHFFKDEQRNSYILERQELEKFDSAQISIENARLRLIPSDGYYVEYNLDGTGEEPVCTVEDGTLVFQEKPSRGHMEVYVFGWGTKMGYEKHVVNLYVPEDCSLDELIIDNAYGDVELEEIENCGNLELNLESGLCKADTLQAERISLNNIYGETEIGTLKTGEGSIHMETGFLLLDTCEAGNLEIVQESGDFTSESLEADQLSIENTYGSLKLGTVKTGVSNLTLETGGVRALKYQTDSMKAVLESGDLRLGECTIHEGSADLTYGKAILGKAKLGHMKIASETGDVTIELADKASEYTMDLYTVYGKIDCQEEGQLLREEEEDGERFYRESTKEKKLDIRCESGNITVY